MIINVLGALGVHEKIRRVMALIDSSISSQLNLILHDLRLLSLEASWRGLHFFLFHQNHVNGHAYQRISLLSIAEAELLKDLNYSMSFEQTTFFSQLYTQEYDMPGGKPYGLLLFDYQVDPLQEHQWYHALEVLSHIAGACFVPVLLNVAIGILGLEDISAVNESVDWKSHFNSSFFASWQRLRCRDDSRYLNVLLQRYLYRPPYVNRYQGDCNLQFVEHITDSQQLCWGSSVYLVGRLVLDCYQDTLWFNDIYLYSLQPELFYSMYDTARLSPKSRFESRWSHAIEKVLAAEGFMVLEEGLYDRQISLKVAQSILSVLSLSSSLAQINVDQFFVSCLFPYVLCACRFAQYLKVIARDKVGSNLSCEELECQLQQWLHRYCGQIDDTDPSRAAKYPLASAFVRIEMKDQASGHYWCYMDLKPNYRIESLDATLKLVSVVKC